MTIGEFAGLLSLQAVLAALAGWLGKVWAERVARTEQARLTERLTRLESSLEAVTHIHKAQYEKEFQIYCDLWIKLLNMMGAISAFPVIKFPEAEAHEQHTKQVEFLNRAVGEFAATLEHNRPFYSDGVYEALHPCYEFATRMWMAALTGADEREYMRSVFQNTDALQRMRDDVLTAIRQRMNEITVVG